MEAKRILVVDDDPDLLFLVAHGIKSLSPNYRVGTAAGAMAALEKIKKNRFDLVVTDYMMPDMTGLDLVSEARKISQDTRFVVMTAHHDTNRIKELVDTMQIDGFVGKPFILPELLDVIQQTALQSAASVPKSSNGTEAQKKEILNKLNVLRQQTGAFNVLLTNADGYPLHVVGERNPAKISRLAAFVASNFLAITELTALFGDSDASFKSCYYEGNNYHIYAYNLGGEFFLAVIFGADVKPGSVWFYTKQTVASLAKLLRSSGAAEAKTNDVSMLNDFDVLFGNHTDENPR